MYTLCHKGFILSCSYKSYAYIFISFMMRVIIIFSQLSTHISTAPCYLTLWMQTWYSLCSQQKYLKRRKCLLILLNGRIGQIISYAGRVTFIWNNYNKVPYLNIFGFHKTNGNFYVISFWNLIWLLPSIATCVKCKSTIYSLCWTYLYGGPRLNRFAVNCEL